MELTKPQKRELLWLASVCEKSGEISSTNFVSRHASFAGKPKDLVARYNGLKELGFVDSLAVVGGQEIVSTRITEEGQERASDLLAEELKQGSFPDDVKGSITTALTGKQPALPFELCIQFLGLM